MNAGAVGDLRNVKSAAKVARLIMDYTQHTILASEQASRFAVSLGLEYEDLETQGSLKLYEDWKKNSCQPNYWTESSSPSLLIPAASKLGPNPLSSCVPYTL